MRDVPASDYDYWFIAYPYWPVWEKTQKARLWEAAALLCGYEPGLLEADEEPGRLDLMHITLKLHTLLGLAKTGVGAGLLKVLKVDQERLENSEVDLNTFTTWANSFNWPLPEGLPWTPNMDLSISGWPWGRYETELLRKLAAAADKWWKNYDPSDPTTAPTNDQVAEWLVKRSVSSTNANAIARILRADHVPMGRRKK
jgi:hypothetical protein